MTSKDLAGDGPRPRAEAPKTASASADGADAERIDISRGHQNAPAPDKPAPDKPASATPDLQKDGYQSGNADDAREAQNVLQPQRGGYYPDAGGPIPGPARPVGGGVPDLGQPIRGFPNVGRSDLNPLAGLDGTTTGRVPYGGGFGGDGMIVGPDHPLFRDRFTGPAPSMPGMPDGNGNILPPGAAPPGARFDPIGPGGPFPSGGRRGDFGGGMGGFGGPRRGGGFGGGFN